MIIKLQWKNYEGGGSHVSFDTEDIQTLIEAKEGNARITLKNGYSMTAEESHAYVHDLWVQGRSRAEALAAGVPPPPPPLTGWERGREAPPLGAPSWGYQEEPPADAYDDDYGRS